MKRYLIFTDLDGTLLDHEDYSYGNNKKLISRIVSNQNEIIFNTSKTFSECTNLLKELKKNRFNVSFNSVYQSIKKRDESDQNRRIAPLKIVKDAYLINTTNLTINETFNKIKKIIDGKNLT